MQANKAAAQQAAEAAEAADQADKKAAEPAQVSRPEAAEHLPPSSLEVKPLPARHTEAAVQPSAAEQAVEPAAADKSAKAGPNHMSTAHVAAVSQPSSKNVASLLSTSNEAGSAAPQAGVPASKPLWQSSQASHFTALMCPCNHLG